MAELIRRIISGYNMLFNEMPDPRTKSWPLVAKPYQGLTILFLYLMFVLKWGPKLMKNRKPFNLDKVMIIYNGVQVICCAYIVVTAITKVWDWGQKYTWVCEPVDYSESDYAMLVTRTVYLYYLLKIADLADTIFFVLRKKFNQLSFLHIYHHAGMVAVIWTAITYLPGGHGSFVGVINSFVHSVMYFYYMLTVAFPAIKQYVAFKKLVTQIQIVQFFLCSIHFGAICFVPDCAYPRWTAAVFLPQNIFMLVLFLDFYIKTYIRKPKQSLCSKNTVVEEKEESITLDYDTEKVEASLNNKKEGDLRHLIRSNSKIEKRC
ncbi:elongation of very long chain fatty acids protein 7-like [Bicyclus anynana]|uniref:Elongation of very long chain fatty acids protein n=1 Tax=Bicyclus anynana TaxID=110368 RepID=A0A6J1N4K4_BICAN|nr:elongation of very long chain fatty acids protein 7-like [Bicyclus anynana]